MTSDTIILSKTSDGVATLTLNNPQLHNAFDDIMIAKILEALKDVAQDASVRLLVLQANGKSFCAGGDLNWMQRMVNFSYEENLHDADQLAELMYQLANLPQPTIANVHGAAYGGGVGLIACCDIVVAQEDTSFCLSEVKLGLIPAVISPYVLAKIGIKAMQRYSLTAEVFDAIEAKRIGLIDEVVGFGEAEVKIQRIVASLLKNGPEALRHVKVLLKKIREPKSFAEIRQDTIETIAERRVSKEGQEGLKAFLEKRKPNWIKE